mgnify:CR=1 FL=1
MLRPALALTVLCLLSACGTDDGSGGSDSESTQGPKCTELCGIMYGCGADPGQCASQCEAKEAHSSCRAAVNDEYLQCATTNSECDAIRDCFADNKLGSKMFACVK